MPIKSAEQVNNADPVASDSGYTSSPPKLKEIGTIPIIKNPISAATTASTQKIPNVPT